VKRWRQIAVLSILLLVGGILGYLGSPAVRLDRERETIPAVRSTNGGGISPNSRPDIAGQIATPSPLEVGLGEADHTIERDLEILEEIFAAWRTNFPGDGNPVGENDEITQALAGRNSLGLVLISPANPAIDERGRLTDRWGTPFRFHQISGTHMEIRSAGPDRRFGTPDDAITAGE